MTSPTSNCGQGRRTFQIFLELSVKLEGEWKLDDWFEFIGRVWKIGREIVVRHGSHFPGMEDAWRVTFADRRVVTVATLEDVAALQGLRCR